MLILIAFMSFLAGIVQGVTGFGAGIVIMMALPHYFAMIECAAMVSAIALPLCVFMLLRYRQEIEIEKALMPTFLYMIVCSVTINFSMTADPVIIQKIFGVFMIMLSIYYLFFSGTKKNQQLSFKAGLFCIIVSGICDGLFGIGGPLMVIYFLCNTNSVRAYLGTLQLFFCINSVYTTGFRIFKGILTSEHVIYVFFGAAGILAGLYFANKIVDRLNPEMIRKLTYIMIGVSGVVNLV